MSFSRIALIDFEIAQQLDEQLVCLTGAKRRVLYHVLFALNDAVVGKPRDAWLL